jgi:hypothetical protein
MMTPTHDFLAYVTLGSISQIRFLPLKTLLDLDLLSGSEDNLYLLTEGYEPQNVERGSKLDACIHFTHYAQGRTSITARKS